MAGINEMLPVRISNFNVYLGETKQLGVSGEIKLPNLEALSETLSGAGILGELEVGNPGHFGPLPVEIPFNTLDARQFQMLKNSDDAIVVRGASQYLDQATSKLNHVGVKVTIKGPRQSNDLGTFAVGKPTGSQVTVDAWYLKVEVNNEIYVEIDKLNWVYILNGEDQLADMTPHM